MGVIVYRPSSPATVIERVRSGNTDPAWLWSCGPWAEGLISGQASSDRRTHTCRTHTDEHTHTLPGGNESDSNCSNYSHSSSLVGRAAWLLFQSPQWLASRAHSFWPPLSPFLLLFVLLLLVLSFLNVNGVYFFKIQSTVFIIFFPQ